MSAYLMQCPDCHDGFVASYLGQVRCIKCGRKKHARTPLAGYRRLQDGVRCRCVNLWRDADGSHWCCVMPGNALGQMPVNPPARTADYEFINEDQT